MHATDGAVRGAGFLCQKFALEIGFGVPSQRDSGEATLLRAVVHQPIFADVEITRPGPAAPVIGLAISDSFLELIEARVVALLPVAHFEVNAAFFVLERLE